MLDGSDPALGSVSPKQPIASPPAISGSQRSFCSSEPKAWIALHRQRTLHGHERAQPAGSTASSSVQASPYWTALPPGQP